MFQYVGFYIYKRIWFFYIYIIIYGQHCLHSVQKLIVIFDKLPRTQKGAALELVVSTGF